MIAPIIPLTSDTPRLGALLWDRHSQWVTVTLRKLLWETLTGHSCGTLLRNTLVGHSCRLTLLGGAPTCRTPCRTFLWDTLAGQLEFYKTRVSFKTSFKGHTSNLQNERFARDFFQNSLVKSSKRAFRGRLLSKTHT